jgi:hypothetical protein
MNFYVPIFNDRRELVRDYARELLRDTFGLAITRRRIRALVWEGGEEEHYIMVGGDFDDAERHDDPVLLILESRNSGLYYVYALNQLATDDIPHPMFLNEQWRVVEFDEW